MRTQIAALRLATAGVVITGIAGLASVAIAAPAPSIAGTWKGPFLSSNFIFEFKQSGGSWTGRYQSEKFRKWVDLQNVTFADGTLRFTFQSQPPSDFTLRIDATGKVLNGWATFGKNPPLPLLLTRHLLSAIGQR